MFYSIFEATKWNLFESIHNNLMVHLKSALVGSLHLSIWSVGRKRTKVLSLLERRKFVNGQTGACGNCIDLIGITCSHRFVCTIHSLARAYSTVCICKCITVRYCTNAFEWVGKEMEILQSDTLNASHLFVKQQQ